MYHLSSSSLDTKINLPNEITNTNLLEKDNTVSSFRKKHKPYKHVPHREKPPQIVARRNARERNRVRSVNEAFLKLRNIVPFENTRGTRLSKLKTLLYAIEYIGVLNSILNNTSTGCSLEMIKYEEKFANDSWNDEQELNKFIY